MKAVVYSPYWNTLGGGEKYLASAVRVLLDDGYGVDIWWNDESLPDRIYNRFGLDVRSARINLKGFEVMDSGSLIDRYQLQRGLDIFLMVSDGSVPIMCAKKNLLHFQVPFHDVGGGKLWTRLKIMTASKVICNSKFTKEVVDREYSIDSQVVYPPSGQFKSAKKENMILTIGRLDNLMHSKRQDVLVKAFNKLNRNEWQLVVLGGSQHKEGGVEVARLKKLAEGNNVRYVVNPNFKTVSDYYAKASIYWHAAGFGIDQISNPEKVEHFGMSTVEAMSAEAVPVVYAAGGQLEIVEHDNYGYLYSSVDELVSLTQKLIDLPELRVGIGKQAKVRSKKYSMEAFEKSFKQLIG